MYDTIVHWSISVVAATVAYTIVCRAVKMSIKTHRGIRWSFAAVGGTAFALAIVPWFRDALFDTIVLLFVSAVLWAQFVTARYWSAGIPYQFEKKD